MNKKILGLIDELNKATLAYDEGKPYMSDEQWDEKYFELVELEAEYDFYDSNSPTQKVVYQVVNALEKVEHSHQMLSLDKTKSLESVAAFIGKHSYLAMCKMDGLTCSLTYANGRLVSAETRGNGVIGEDILHNALVIPSIPNKIKYKDTLIVDGEIICTYQDFESFSSEYKNPRNFAAGSIRLLDANECAQRKLKFVAWDVIEGIEEEADLSDRLDRLADYGFTVVPYIQAVIPSEETVNVVNENIETWIKDFAKKNSYPIDGIVFKINNVEYGRSLGQTAHHFKNAIAYKFYDETYPSTLKKIEWTMGRTGVLTPIAIFEPIDIDGSTVERASLHNISVMEELLGGTGFEGQQVEVYKANMIIPQILTAEKSVHGPLFEIPNICPICGNSAEECITDGSVKVLMCKNPSCEGKLINKLDHFCGKKGLDIKGLSKMTLEKLIAWGWVSNIRDIFNLKDYAKTWKTRAGFGEKSVQKILDAIDEKRVCSLQSFICALGIPLIGSTASKELCKYFTTWDEFRNAIRNHYKFFNLEGFGAEMHLAIMNFDYTMADLLVEEELHILAVEKAPEVEATLDGKSVVITGKLQHYKNRDAMKADIELFGGKVVGSVSKNTSFLINNDNTSTSSKNVSAQKLGVPILTEQEFIEKFLTK